MSMFRSTDHRQILIDAVAYRKVSRKKFSISALAVSIGVQKTYASRVMSGEACWSTEQAFMIACELEFVPDEIEYFSILVERERSVSAKRQSYLKKKVADLRRRNLRTQNVLKSGDVAAGASLESEYFADPYHSLAHVYLSLPRFQRNVAALGKELGLNAKHWQGILERLEKMGLISRKGDQVKVKQSVVHSPAGSPLVLAHQHLFRALAADRLHRCPADRRNTFNAVFSGDASLQETIWAEFLIFLEKAKKLSENSNEEEVFYFQFDLFPWCVSPAG